MVSQRLIVSIVMDCYKTKEYELALSCQSTCFRVLLEESLTTLEQVGLSIEQLIVWFHDIFLNNFLHIFERLLMSIQWRS